MRLSLWCEIDEVHEPVGTVPDALSFASSPLWPLFFQFSLLLIIVIGITSFPLCVSPPLYLFRSLLGHCSSQTLCLCCFVSDQPLPCKALTDACNVKLRASPWQPHWEKTELGNEEKDRWVKICVKLNLKLIIYFELLHWNRLYEQHILNFDILVWNRIPMNLDMSVLWN